MFVSGRVTHVFHFRGPKIRSSTVQMRSFRDDEFKGSRGANVEMCVLWIQGPAARKMHVLGYNVGAKNVSS